MIYNLTPNTITIIDDKNNILATIPSHGILNVINEDTLAGKIDFINDKNVITVNVFNRTNIGFDIKEFDISKIDSRDVIIVNQNVFNCFYKLTIKEKQINCQLITPDLDSALYDKNGNIIGIRKFLI